MHYQLLFVFDIVTEFFNAYLLYSLLYIFIAIAVFDLFKVC